jgi:hypothetical protein
LDFIRFSFISLGTLNRMAPPATESEHYSSLPEENPRLIDNVASPLE